MLPTKGNNKAGDHDDSLEVGVSVVVVVAAVIVPSSWVMILGSSDEIAGVCSRRCFAMDAEVEEVHRAMVISVLSARYDLLWHQRGVVPLLLWRYPCSFLLLSKDQLLVSVKTGQGSGGLRASPFD
jgi:hypothetical protein